MTRRAVTKPGDRPTVDEFKKTEEAPYLERQSGVQILGLPGQTGKEALALGDSNQPAADAAPPPTLTPTRAPKPRIVPGASVQTTQSAKSTVLAGASPPKNFDATGNYNEDWKDAADSRKPTPPAARKPASGTRGGAGDFVSPVGGVVGTIQGATGGSGTLATDEDADGDGTVVTSGLRSGDQAINRNSIDAILNNPNRVSDRKDSLAANDKQVADRVPVLGDVPVLGKLFSDKDRERKLADLNGKQDDRQEQGQAPSIFSITGLPSENLEKAIAAKQTETEASKSDMSDRSDKSDMTTLSSLTGKTAHDRTREELLAQVDAAWDLPAPMHDAGKDSDHKLNDETHTGYFSSTLAAGAKRADSMNYYLDDDSTKITPPPVLEGFINYGAPIAEGGKIALPEGKSAADKEQTAELKKAVDTIRSIMPGVDPEAGQLMDVLEAARAKLKADPANKELRNALDRLDHKEQPADAKPTADASLALALQDRKEGKTTEARSRLEGVLAADPANATAKRELGYLDDPIRTNPALTADGSQNVDKVRRGLYTAEGNYNLGKYDDAKREYENVLRTDPYNKAARRGMEKLAAAKSDSYRAAYDQTRSELLSQVDAAWELPVPDEKTKEKGAKAEKMKKNLQETDAPLPAPEKPKPDLTKLIEEVAAAEEPYSTFSLNISDASFKVAQAALARGERPDPAGIKEEQFYNAVDYGDPSPTAGEPVAVAIEQAAHPFIPGRNLVRVALKTAAAGRAATQPLRLTLLVDQSGSMVRDDRRAAMDKALAGLSSLLTANDRVTVIGFARTPRLLADDWTGEQAAKLAVLINQTANEGGTNLEEAIKLGEQLADRHKLANAQNRIVLFTDGAANLGDADPAHLAAKVKALRQKGIAFDIAGIAADDLNDELLGELARNGNGRYYVVGKGADDGIARQLAGAFRPAAENVKVQVHFNQERVARYKLIGFEKDRLKTEDFRNDAVAAAEMAAEEAGVAIYQVEPIPGGTGELGDVSVRFRDTASGQMVERTWNIPHDASAPAIDRAKPSMQLAVLAMLAADKLRGGPLAEAIDFKHLAEPRANVKRFYGTTGRAAEVLHMIDGL